MNKREEAICKDNILASLNIKQSHATVLSEELNVDFSTLWKLIIDIESDGYINTIDACTNDGDDLVAQIKHEGKYFVSNSSYLEEYGIEENETENIDINIKSDNIHIGDNFGKYNQSSSKINTTNIAANTASPIITKILIGIFVGVVVAIIVWAIFG